MAKNENLTNKIIAFETGGFTSEEEVFDLFQELVDTGLAWQLQGSYGRTAHSLLELGLILPPDRYERLTKGEAV